MAKKEKRLGFKPVEERVCDMVREQVDAELKKVRSLVRSEVKSAVKEALEEMSGRLATIEQQMIATFGKVQGEIEMLSRMEQQEDMGFISRMNRIEMELAAQRKILESHAQTIDQISRSIKDIIERLGSAPSSNG